MEGNKHYIRLDVNNNIIKGFSDSFEQPQSGDICINENGIRHFELYGVISPILINSQGIYLYKYINNEVVLKTDNEIQQEVLNLPMHPKTEIEILQSQLKDVKQMLSLINQSNSDFIDYVFASIPDLQQ